MDEDFSGSYSGVEIVRCDGRISELFWTAKAATEAKLDAAKAAAEAKLDVPLQSWS